MDVPASEELEWLETNALLPEEEEELEEVAFKFVQEGEREHLLEIPKNHDSDPLAAAAAVPSNPAGKKRERSEETGENTASGKRRASVDVSDEDWLRYSPPKDAALDAADEKIISRFASEIDGECMPVTGPSGDRVYAKMSSGDMGGGQRKLTRERPADGLLMEPITVLSERVEQEALTKILQASFGSPKHHTESSSPSVTEKLWVEKYAPNSFTELLSDEQTNREVLLWLKQWDSTVFGTHIRSTADDVLSSLRQHSSVTQHHKFSSDKSFFSKNKGPPFSSQNVKSSENLRENNNLKRVNELVSRKSVVNHPPEQKILLLCGPPGLGKTTLAHVAAKHCGYHVVEVNASDDRAASVVESKILDVVQMNSVMPGSKPKCLVIDEIDGALGEGKGAVEVILKMVAAEKRSNDEKANAAQEPQAGKAKKKQQKRTKLSRPVICICNDLYAPALRPLRQVAKVHSFVQPTVSRVVNRLKYICKKEGYRTSTTALSALAEYTECDIRSCLNTLQFLNKKKETLNIMEVSSQVVGRKDMSKSVLDVWKELFQKRKLKRERKFASGCRGHGDFDFMYSLISNRGEYELIMEGIYENFLRLSYHDPMMQKTVKCLETLCVSDSLLRYVLRTQQMSLHVYQPPVAMTMTHLIAQVEKPNIEWPKTSQRCRALLTEKKDVLKVWQNKLLPCISRHLSTGSFVEDVVSLFLHILSPPTLRPVAVHLLSEREKDDLAQLVDTMVSYSVTYKNLKVEPPQKTHYYGTAPDASQLSLDPPIDDFVKFKDHQPEYSALSVTMKQVLVHEVEKQRILRESISRCTSLSDESKKEEEASSNNTKIILARSISTSEYMDGSSKLETTFNQRQKITYGPPDSSSIANRDISASGVNLKRSGDSKRPSHSSNFFDRFRKGSGSDSKVNGESLQKTATMERDSRPLLFKYNEGFTNAVKRPVKMRDLLL